MSIRHELLGCVCVGGRGAGANMSEIAKRMCLSFQDFNLNTEKVYFKNNNLLGKVDFHLTFTITFVII